MEYEENERVELADISGYVPIKEAAQMLGLSDKTVYHYVSVGKIKGVRASHIILIPIEEVEKFQRGTTGRPRKSIPVWHISPAEDVWFATFILVQISAGQQKALQRKLNAIRLKQEHIFPGTVARFIVNNDKDNEQIFIVLIWRSSVMPDEPAREEALEAFRRELADVLDWSTAQYNHGTVLMHT
jgi:excisionase family DNA binding protein